MKTIRIYIILFIVTLFYGCSSSDEQSSSNQLLLGKWYYKGTKINNNPIVLYQHQCSTSKSYRDFLENGTINKVTYYSDCGIYDDNLETTWLRTNNTLTLTDFSPETQFTVSNTYEIVNLTDQEMQLKQTIVNSDNTIIYIYYYSRT